MTSTRDRKSGFQLPNPATRLIGRDREIESACQMLRDPEARLVTLTGPGGVGKTRLALAVAQRLQQEYRDGVVYIELAPLRDSSLVASTIAGRLGVRERGEQPILEGLKSALREQELLLLLDNFEHLVDSANDLADLLVACPRLTLLVTSRVPLHLRAEQVIAVRPLSIPEPEAVRDLSLLVQNPSVALFVERARAGSPDFELTSANAGAVAGVCTRLDGLPLAIELAASRAGVLSPATLLARLEDSLATLVRGPRDLPPRQQTLRDTIAWSYELLTAEQQRVFRHLAVFLGPWTLDAAEVVAENGDIDTLPCIEALLEHNLLISVGDINGSPSFSMLQTIREFAYEQLIESGDERAARERHAKWVLSFSQSLAARRRTLPSSQVRMLFSDIRSAVSWMSEHGDPGDHLRLVSQVGHVSATSASSSEEGLRWIEGALERTAATTTLARSHALCVAAQLKNLQGDGSGAITCLNESLSIARKYSHTFELANSLMAYGAIAQDKRNFSDARRYLDEALDIAVSLGEHALRGEILMFKALTASGVGENQQAIELAESSVRLMRAVSSPINQAHALNALAIVLTCAEKFRRAATTLAETITTDDNRWALTLSMAGLTHVTQRVGYPARAALLSGFVDALCRRLNAVLLVPERDLYREAVVEAREAIGEERFQSAYQSGKKLTPTQGIAYALETIEVLVADAPYGETIEAVSQASDATHGLTPRELEVLRLIAQGCRNREIAEALFISPKTADNHVSNILSKLGVSSRTAAARFATENQLIERVDS